MLAILTRRAQRAFRLASSYARSRGSSVIEPLDLLVGILAEDSGAAAAVLRSVGIDYRRLTGSEKLNVSEDAEPLAPSEATQCILDAARAKSLAIKDCFVGTEVLLLSLLDAGDEALVLVFARLNVDPASMRGMLAIVTEKSIACPSEAAASLSEFQDAAVALRSCLDELTQRLATGQPTQELCHAATGLCCRFVIALRRWAGKASPHNGVSER